MDFLTSPLFLLFARLCVGGVFVASGISKWLDKPGTEAGMSKYLFLPKGSGRFIANVFPVLELAVGLLLIFGLFTRLAAVAAVLLFLLFTGLIIYDLARGKTESCHCFGKLSDEKLTPMAVVRNVLLMGMAVLVALAFDGWLAIDGPLNEATKGSLGFLVSRASAATASTPDAANVVPVVLLSLLTVIVVVFGGQAISMVRNTLRGLGFR